MEKRIKVWSVGESMPGCLPESNPILFDESKDALIYFDELKRELDELIVESDYIPFYDGPFFVDAYEWYQYNKNNVYPVLHNSELDSCPAYIEPGDLETYSEEE